MDTEGHKYFFGVREKVRNATKIEMNDLSLDAIIDYSNGDNKLNNLEVQNDQPHSRWIINPEFVSKLDATDGSKQYDN